MERAYAIILAGGNGERFWPVSTPERPKQFVTLFGGKPLIRHAVDRLAGLIPPERTLVITAQRFVGMTRRALPMIPRENILGEPCRRNTAAAVAVACGLVKRLGGADAVGCVLTADQLMKPEAKFRATLADCIRQAAATDAIVTMGVVPTYPATGFGYIECGEVQPAAGRASKTEFHKAKRFVEKPDAATAAKYVKAETFLWNAGMFIWKVSTMQRAFQVDATDIGLLIDEVAASAHPAATLKKLYPETRAISVDYAVMEKARNILVARSTFAWDDVGSWQAVENHFARTQEGNTLLGKTTALDTRQSVVVTDEDHLVAVLGLDNVVVVHTPKATLVCAKDRVQDIRRLLHS